MPNENLLVGFDTSDDACVYKVSDALAIIQTVDFFPPMVDDPYLFGQVAAANALSDVYAMGGTPTLAMNLLCVPNCLPLSAVAEILKGGADKALEAGCVIAGGHSIADNEPKYGLCVMGTVAPDRIFRNVGAQVGDVLVLTKPLGSGILNTANSAEMLSSESAAVLFSQMTTLNRNSAEALAGLTVHACTDITGFGLMGHASEMAGDGDACLVIEAERLPILPDAVEFAAMGFIPGGAYRNRDYVGDRAEISKSIPQPLADIVFDPQTSGGLLISLSAQDANTLLTRLANVNAWARIIGRVEQRKGAAIKLVSIEETEK